MRYDYLKILGTNIPESIESIFQQRDNKKNNGWRTSLNLYKLTKFKLGEKKSRFIIFFDCYMGVTFILLVNIHIIILDIYVSM